MSKIKSGLYTTRIKSVRVVNGQPVFEFEELIPRLPGPPPKIMKKLKREDDK